MAHPESATLAPGKHRGESSKDHSASIPSERKDDAHKAKLSRKRPYGILPARIARVERHIEGLCALKDDEKLFARAAHIDDVLDRHEYHAHYLYAHKKIGFACYERSYKKVRELRHKMRSELLVRRRQLRDQIIPEVQNLCTQADRDAA